MLDSNSITRRAAEMLSAKGLKPDLSEQAKAVVVAITEAINAQVLDLEASNNNFERQLNVVKQTPAGRMKKPTLEEVRSHGITISLPTNECDKFFDHFESNGWKVGMSKTPMKLWTAALANWKRTWIERTGMTARIEGVPTLSEIHRYADEKYPLEHSRKGWAATFFTYWNDSKRAWKKNGVLIDWKIHFSNNVTNWKVSNP